LFAIVVARRRTTGNNNTPTPELRWEEPEKRKATLIVARDRIRRKGEKDVERRGRKEFTRRRNRSNANGGKRERERERRNDQGRPKKYG